MAFNLPKSPRLPRALPLAMAMILAAQAAPLSAREMTPAQIHATPQFKAAISALRADHDRLISEIVAITEIPAPPFKEAQRGKAYAEMLRSIGFAEVSIDDVGNVIALRPGRNAKAKAIVLSAHLDTVFPEGTPIKVRREGTRLYAPGIGDDSRSLAVLLAFARALDAAKISTERPILFVGTVGEEGEGDLRGVRHLFTKSSWKDRIAAFFSMDGTDARRVTHGGVGSKRYRIRFDGPGGHSYGAFGIVNPMAAMAGAVSALYAIKAPTTPRTTYSASVVSGGTSVNTIPASITLEVDMRSESPAALAALDAEFRAGVDKAVAAENAARITRLGSVVASYDVIGERPAGETPVTAPLVTATSAAIKLAGYEPILGASSTDSNIPMSLGIPAVTIGSGGSGERAHTVDEFIDVEIENSVRGMTAALLAVLSAAGVRR